MVVGILFLIIMMAKFSTESYCNIPNECEVIKIKDINYRNKNTHVKCLLTDGTRLRFNRSSKSIDCKQFNTSDIESLIIRPKYELSVKLAKETIDLKDIIEFTMPFRILIKIDFYFFKGFDLNLFDEESIELEKNLYNKNNMENKYVSLEYSTFDFFYLNRKLTTCQDFIDVTERNSTDIRSIFQMITIMKSLILSLSPVRSKMRLCPLVFQNFKIQQIGLSGENTFYSKRFITFSNDSFKDLNSTIEKIDFGIQNAELGTDFLHPDVFKEVIIIKVRGNVKIIHPNLFIKLNKVANFELSNENLRSLMHNGGIEWIKNMNKDVNCNLENSNELRNKSSKKKFILIGCFNNPNQKALEDVFPDEDFCLYKDFPINQLVTVVEYYENNYELLLHNNITCTYLWITRSYKYLIKSVNPNTWLRKIMIKLLKSNEYKSISKCEFNQKLKLCNKSTFALKHFITSFEINDAMKMVESIINILSYILSIFGIVTNLMIIITISSKKTKADFKEYKQYDYLRLNSIFSCLIFLIQLISWLNQCIYPFQVFCPIIRKTLFMQYFKLILKEVLMNAFKFMNSFTYIGFAFNRISLIGKDHNKLVKFMSELGIKKYIAVTLFISIGLSVIKFFEYDINIIFPYFEYPIPFEYTNILANYHNPTLYVLNFISDLFNYFILLILNFAIDIGMIIKLRQTLKEKLEKSKEFNTKAQQEKKRVENETAMENTRSMIIWNISLNMFLKLPATSYTSIYLYYILYKSNPQNYFNHPGFARFFIHICINTYFCNCLFKLADFLYLLYISIQLFFYKHFDKKFSQSFKKIFIDK